MSSENQWFVLTGGPSTGKTSLLAALQDAGYYVVPEAARLVIDEGVAAGRSVAEIRSDEKAFQGEVTKRKVIAEATAPTNKPIFFDRGMHDSVAYLQYYNYAVDDWVLEACNKARYRQVFLLEPLPTFESDYARIEVGDFATSIQTLLHDAYAYYGMEPIMVPAIDMKQRLTFILNRIQTTKEHIA